MRSRRRWGRCGGRCRGWGGGGEGRGGGVRRGKEEVHEGVGGGEVIDEYDCGIHPRWYLREGVRMAVIAEVDVEVDDVDALEAALGELIREQPLLRSVLRG